jgi:uncharacterized protein (TIGR02217 family)
MSEEIFPVLPGLQWNRKKIPMWSTQIQTAFSGLEKRASNWSYPRWQFETSYEVLEDSIAESELKKVISLFQKVRGNFDSFLYEDEDDHHAENQVIGIGDGEILKFQLVREYADFIEPVRGVKGVPVLSVAGDPVVDFDVSNTGLITFLEAPVGEIRATFDFYFRVRFIDSEMELTKFLYKLWNLKKCEFISLKGAEK